ncbi:MAG TPA: carboxymuconolactone decarboxylase family protein [Actinomycetota bacterium]|nr:carboxymuconolactone decarboxylase family protein [Actinomycetota bacterium]
MTDPRIVPGTRSDTGWLNWTIASVAGRVAGTSAPNLFLTLARHRTLFRGWLMFAGRLMPRGKLPRRESELVILRVAHLCTNSYEFEHHARLGRRAGLTDGDLDAITRALAEGPWSDREATILTAVDQLHTERDLDEDAWTALRRHLDERDCIEFLMLVGHYEMLATFLGTLRVPLDSRRA